MPRSFRLDRIEYRLLEFFPERHLEGRSEPNLLKNNDIFFVKILLKFAYLLTIIIAHAETY